MRTALLLVVTALAACTLNYSDEDWAATFSGKEFGHVFYHHEDQQISKRGVSLPSNSPSIISDFRAKHGDKGGSPSRPHDGIDFYGPVGAPVLAAADGKVIAAGMERGLGRFILAEHGQTASGEPLYALYLHFSKILVGKKEDIKRGKRIGEIGTSGHYGGVSHVHLSLYTGRVVNRGYDYWGLWKYLDVKSNISPHPLWSGGLNTPQCFDADENYPTDRTVLTIPVVCK